VIPTLDELRKFTKGKSGEPGKDDGMAKMLRDVARRRKMVFQKGDVVRIITGETKGLVCIVKQVKEQTVVLTARDASLALATDIEVSPAQLEKYFQVNDHVKILEGLYRGQTGTITSVNNSSGLPYATMLPDSHSIKKAMEAFTRDLVLTTEHSGAVELSGDAAGSADGAAASGDAGMRRAGQSYQLDDLVQLDADIRAVVVRVEYDHYVLVDNFNKMHRLTPDQIQGRKMSKSTANDKYRNIVSQGDEIYVVHGRKDLLKKTGTVRQIWKGTLFVALSDRTELPDTNGIFVIRSSDVYLLGGRTVESKEPKEFYRPPPRSENGPAARGGGRPGGKGREVDPLVGKRVMMSKGIQRGMSAVSSLPPGRTFEWPWTPGLRSSSVRWMMFSLWTDTEIPFCRMLSPLLPTGEVGTWPSPRRPRRRHRRGRGPWRRRMGRGRRG
jgi:transcription antitermination factor NusG